MIWIVSVFLTICICAMYIIACKNNSNNSIEKSKIFKTIIVANIILIFMLNFIMPFIKEINLHGLIILVVVNILAFLICNIISKRKSTFIMVTIIYFIIICVIPLYKYDDHRHIFDGEYEKIENYTIYYNSYVMKLFEK